MDEPPEIEGLVNPDNEMAQRPSRLLFPTRGLFPIGNITSVHGFLWSTDLNRQGPSNHVNFVLVLFAKPQGGFLFLFASLPRGAGLQIVSFCFQLAELGPIIYRSSSHFLVLIRHQNSQYCQQHRHLLQQHPCQKQLQNPN